MIAMFHAFWAGSLCFRFFVSPPCFHGFDAMAAPQQASQNSPRIPFDFCDAPNQRFYTVCQLGSVDVKEGLLTAFDLF